MPAFTLSAHAEKVMTERAINVEWLERVLLAPQQVEIDGTDSHLKSALGRIPEYGGRVLRVVYNDCVKPVRIVTVYFDRTQRNKR